MAETQNVMKTIIKIMILILTCFLFGCQNEEQISYPEYYRSINQIVEDVNAGKIDLAISKFDSISKKVPHVPSSHLFYMARICANNDLCELSANYLKKSFESGMEYGKIKSTHKTIEKCPGAISVVLKEERKIHERHFNFTYKTTIDSMLNADQQARINKEYDAVKVIDSVNMNKILNLVEKYGYPGEKIIGYESAFNAFIIMLHMDRDKNNKILGPILKKAYNNGLLWPRGYAWIVDRRRAWGEEKLEPYYYHLTSKEYNNFNNEQISEINRRRDSIGLEPK